MVWFRLLQTFVQSFFSKQTMSLHDKYYLNFKVTPFESDLRFLNNARYLTFMEVARLDMMIKSGIFKKVIKDGWVPLVASQSIRYKRPLRRWDNFQVESQVVDGDSHSFYIEHRFRAKGVTVALGFVRAVILKRGKRLTLDEIGIKIGRKPFSSRHSSIQNSYKAFEDQLEDLIEMKKEASVVDP